MEKSIIKILAIFLIAIAPGSRTMAQDTLRGIVTNASTGEPFAGASLSISGTQKTAMSDENGKFEITGVDLRAVAEVTAPGCEKQYLPLQGRDFISVKVVPVSSSTPFYNGQSMSATVSDIMQKVSNGATAINEDINSRLSGTVRSISQSGIDAAGSTMLVRGLHSINMTSQPLFIVDGVWWQPQEGVSSLHEGYLSNPLALLSPDDIESVQVLKNGTALYGAKAANGVVIINTKRAHNMATEITVNLSMGIKSPFKTIPMMNADEYRVYASEVMRGMEDINNLSSSLHFLNDDSSNSYYLASHNNTNWMDEINSTAITQNYNVSIRGGDDVALYAFSLGYDQNDGNVSNTDFERLHVRFNSDISLTKHLTAKADIAFAQITRNLFDDGINEYYSPTYLAYIKSPLYNPYQFDSSGNLYSKISDTDELGVGNPLAVTENADGETKNYRFNASLRPEYRFTDRFALSAIVALSWDKIKENSFTPDFGLEEVQLYNDQGDWYGEGDNSVASLMTRHTTLTLGADADWDVLTGNHRLSLKGGMLYVNNSFESDYGSGYNTGSDNLKSLEVTTSSLRTTGGYDCDWRTISWHLLADYNWMDRYFLSASATMESNSRFGGEADGALSLCGIKWGLFPSVNAAWIASNENFMRHLPFINYLRLYAGYEITGNDDIPIGATSTYFSSASLTGLAKGLVISNIGNDKLKWEKTATANIGLETVMFGNRLKLGADFFFSRTSDLLVQKTLPEEYGQENYWANDGKLENRGFDINFSVRAIDTKNWKVNLGATIGHYKNEVKELGNGSFTTSVLDGTILTAVGNPLGVFYGYRTLGVFSTQEEADAANLAITADNGEKVYFQAGDMHFYDADGNGIIDDDDRVVIGDPNPDIYGNFNLNVEYKRFSLGAVFTYSLGNDAYNALRASLESGSSMYNQTTNMLNRWTADGQTTSVPRATYGDPMGNSRFSDRWIEDASYLRLSQLTASYTLPIKPRFIQGAQVWVSANNLFTISKYLGSDPAFSYATGTLYQGVDAGLTPSTRSYHIGVKLNL